MELLKTIRRRSVLSETVYIILNVLFAVAVLLVVRETETLLPGLVLVLLSKWRVFAVRPRFWVANIKANLVDFIASISVVVFLFQIDGSTTTGLIAQLVITTLHVAWLVYVKPRSTKRAIAAQAGISMAVGTAALFMVAYAAPVSVVVLGMWLIGFVSARHVLIQYEEDHIVFLSLLWGLLLAQIGWVSYHWTVAYSLPFVDAIQVPQVSIIAALTGLLAYKVYQSQKKHETVRMNDIIFPLLFCVSIVAVLLLIFNSVGIDTL